MSEALARRAVDAARLELCSRLPYFRAALMSFGVRVERGARGVGTDGRDIVCSAEDAIAAFRDERLDRALLHSLFHCLLFHIPREAESRSAREARLRHAAYDAAAERAIALALRGEARVPEISVGAVEREMRSLDDGELARAEEEARADSHAAWPSSWEEAASRASELRRILARQRGAGEGGRSDAPGRSAGGESEEIEIRRGEARMDLRAWLRRFADVREELRTDTESFDFIPYTYGLALYGDMPLVEHLEYIEATRLEELVIAIDTSGSCSAEAVREFLAETYAILSSRENFFDSMNVFLIQCDCAVQSVERVTSRREWEEASERMTIVGRGGTDFRPVFVEVERLRRAGELRDLRALLYFTDGDGAYPERAPDYETAFALLGRKERGAARVPAWAARFSLDGGDAS